MLNESICSNSPGETSAYAHIYHFFDSYLQNIHGVKYTIGNPPWESTDAVRILDVALRYVEEEKIKASLKKLRTEFEQVFLG